MPALDFQNLPPYLNVKEVSAFLGLSKSSTYTLIHSAGFPCVVINRRILIPRDPFLAYMDNLLIAQKEVHNGKTQS